MATEKKAKKQAKKTEKRPVKKKEEEQKEKQQENSLSVSPIFIGIVVGLLFAGGVGFYNQFQNLEEIGAYKACLDIERDPALTVPCTCRPKEINNTDAEFDEVYEKTEAVCICNCILEDGREESIEIRRATDNKETSNNDKLQIPNI